MKFTWSSFKKAEVPTTVGRALDVDLPLFGIEGVRAKIDTGAYSGALHATQIREVKLENGERRLRFSPLGSKDHTLEVATYHRRRVTSSNGMTARRYAINTEIGILGKNYPITITLTNRGSMKFPMLIGRNFLRIHGFLVDVNQKSE
ncbi:MAG TPA: RimK/LysX family protein [Candidatus Saccharimonadales bacterium]|nr:RimK/LysX family protein [Candidatus Saccharimonadales bacterium]